MNLVFLVLLTVAFLTGAAAGALVVVLGYRLVPKVAEAGKRARKPRPPRCYVVEPTDFEEIPSRPRKRKHALSEDEASELVTPERGVNLVV